ncbi:MAG TPA: S4 domain-containing protein [Gammaproteobacteria bacterium]
MPAVNRTAAAPETMRLDKWLWAARFFKTRRLAVEAANGGKVQCNGERVKPGKNIRVGDRLLLRKDIYEYTVDIVALSPRRLSAELAQNLYRETPESITVRESRRASLEAEKAAQPYSEGRPNKRQRRQLLAAKSKYNY